MATGRSDYPNQVNNVLGFPYIFRGALDVRATQINEAMKLAAVKALAELAKTAVPDIVNLAYNEKPYLFGPTISFPNHLIRDCFQPLRRLLPKQPWKVGWPSIRLQIGMVMSMN